MSPMNSDSRGSFGNRNARPASRRDTARVESRAGSRSTDRVDGRPGKPDTARVRRAASDRRWRVTVVAPALEFNGLTLYTLTLVRALVEMGNAVQLLAPRGPLHHSLGGLDVQVVPLPPARQKLGFFGWRKLRAAVESFGPDVLHAVSPDLDLPGVRLADTLERSLCVTIHGIKTHELPKVEDTDFDGYIACDAAVRERLVNDCLLPRRLVTQIGLAVSPMRAPEEAHVMDPRATPAVGMLGPLEDSVGFGAFLDAAGRIGNKSNDTIFTILGDGPRRSEVRKMAEDRGLLQRVVLVDRLFDYSLAWRPFDIIYVDTRQPAAGMMLLSAMAFGLPVVATEGGAVFELVEDGVDGLLVHRDDAEGLAQRFMLLIDNHQERLRMGRAAYERVEQEFSPQSMALALMDTYAALVAGEPLPLRGEGAQGPRRPTRSIK